MSLQHLNVKIFVQDPQKLNLEAINPVFQTWIQKKLLPELLVDVASYLHVPQGPGVLLVGLEADYSLDETRGRWGLRYNRKSPIEASDEAILKSVFVSALKAALLLKNDESLQGQVEFAHDEFELFINDRALAPNIPATYARLLPLFEKFFTQTFGEKNYSIAQEQDPRQRFGLKLKVNQPESFEKILAKLS